MYSMDGLALNKTQEKIGLERLRAIISSVFSSNHQSLTNDRQTEASIYLISDELIFNLSGSLATMIDDMLSIKPKNVITPVRQIKNDNLLKTNIFRQLTDAGVDFKTV